MSIIVVFRWVPLAIVCRRSYNSDCCSWFFGMPFHTGTSTIQPCCRGSGMPLMYSDHTHIYIGTVMQLLMHVSNLLTDIVVRLVRRLCICEDLTITTIINHHNHHSPASTGVWDRPLVTFFLEYLTIITIILETWCPCLGGIQPLVDLICIVHYTHHNHVPRAALCLM
jgi:hypothetical protein